MKETTQIVVGVIIHFHIAIVLVHIVGKGMNVNVHCLMQQQEDKPHEYL